MAVEPGIYNFSIQRRSDHPLPLEFEQPNGSPMNLTGWTVYAQVWDKARTTKYADFTVTYVDRVLGKIQLSLTEAQTAILPNECFYDVKLENPSGIAEYYLEGIIYVSEGYTT